MCLAKCEQQNQHKALKGRSEGWSNLANSFVANACKRFSICLSKDNTIKAFARNVFYKKPLYWEMANLIPITKIDRSSHFGHSTILAGRFLLTFFISTSVHNKEVHGDNNRDKTNQMLIINWWRLMLC